MANPLIATKLHVPRPRGDLVQRERLHALMELGTESRLTLVSAPAGFGKTTLLSAWLAARKADGRGAAWVSLDRTDNEPTAFWAHLITAVQGAGTQLGQSLRPRPDQLPDRALTAALLNALAILDRDLAIILDDFHVIEDTAITDELGFFLEHLPGNVHLVISTRADPPLPLARLRVRGELTEIRTADLRFRPAEASEYFAAAMHLELAANEVERLEERTEGWIAALQLAALSMRGRDDLSAFVANFTGSDRYVVDYLVEEVLRGQPEHIRRFLYGTCMLGRFCGDLCDDVLGTRGSSTTIGALDQQNLFIVALDDRRQWYRYHHLFADVLAAHMPDEERARYPERHRKASLWFEDHGDRDESIRHALAASDFELAARLIELATPEMRRRRRDSALRTSIEALPDALVRSRPALSIGLVGPLLQAGITEGIEARLNEAETRLREMNEAALRAHIGAIELYRSALARMRGDMPAAMAHAQRVFDCAPTDAHLERAGAAGFLAIGAWSQGDLETAQHQWAACTDRLLHIGYIADALGTLYARGQIAMEQGKLDDAERLFERGLSLAAEREGYPLPGSADLHVGLAEIRLERNDLAVAQEHLSASEAADFTGMPQYPSRRLVVLARIAQAKGDAAEALTLLDEAVRLRVGDFFPNVRPIPAMRARLHIAQRDWPAVERWQRDSGVGLDTPLSYGHEYQHTTLARVPLARGDPTSAIKLLERLIGAATSSGRCRAVMEIEILRALGHEAMGNAAGAQSALRHALDLAEPQRHARVFLDEGEPLAALLRRVAKGKVASPFARKLLAAFGASQPSGRVDHPDLLEPLSDRELDVLKLLRGDLSGPDIASELGVSLNTVRTHTKNIYEKLGVNSRRAAVRRAEEMGLLRRRNPA